MVGPTLIIGGERSSGKTTLLNFLTSGSLLSPFPRGVRGRLSRINTTLFYGSPLSGDQQGMHAALKISTHGSNKRDIEIRSYSGDCSDLLLITAHDLNQRILQAQPVDEPTCLTISIESRIRKGISWITEIGPDCLSSFIDSGRIIDTVGSREIALPNVYIHLTSAIKPLAFVERQAIERFVAEKVPVILLVNKCDLVDDDESLREINSLASIFCSTVCARGWLPNFLCCFGGQTDTSKSILDVGRAANYIYSYLLVKLSRSVDYKQAPKTELVVRQGLPRPRENVTPLLESHENEAGEISVWPPVEYEYLVNQLNKSARGPGVLSQELSSLDSATLSRLQTLYWWQLSPDARRLLLTLKRQAQ